MVQGCVGFQTSPSPAAPEETPAQREARIRYEAEVIEQGIASIKAGNGIDLADARAWLKALDADKNAPRPGGSQPSFRR